MRMVPLQQGRVSCYFISLLLASILSALLLQLNHVHDLDACGLNHQLKNLYSREKDGNKIDNSKYTFKAFKILVDLKLIEKFQSQHSVLLYFSPMLSL